MFDPKEKDDGIGIELVELTSENPLDTGELDSGSLLCTTFCSGKKSC